jgi:hypothetical protein
MSDAMDVDDIPTHPPNISQSAPVYSSSPPIPQDIVNKFKAGMTKASKFQDWPDKLRAAEGDKTQVQNVFRAALCSFWREASQSDLQKHVIDLSANADIIKVVRSLNVSEIEEWKSIIHKGGWVDLIMHLMYLAPFLIRYIVIWYWHSETSETSC